MQVKNISEFARQHGLSPQVVEYRLRSGWKFGKLNGRLVLYSPKHVMLVKKTSELIKNER